MTNSENNSLFKQPSAWIPLLMSFAALAMILVYVAINGFASSGNGDEGAPARIFQLIMLAQLPIAGYFRGQVAAQATEAIFDGAGAAGCCMDHSDRHDHVSRKS